MRYNTLQLLAYAAIAISSLVMPLYASQLGASTQTIGVIGAAYGGASFLSNYLFGRAGDVRDRRQILLLGFGLSTFALLSQAFARTPNEFLVARFAAGFAIGIIPPTLAAYVYELKRPLGKFTSYNAAGWLVASLLLIGVGYLATHRFSPGVLETVRERLIDQAGPYEALLVASAAFCLVALVPAWGLGSMRRGLRVPFFPREVLRRNFHVYLAVFVRHVGATGIWTIFPLYVLSLGGDLALVGWINLLNMVAQILVFRNVENFPRLGSARFLIGTGLVLSGVTFLGFTLVSNALQLLPLQVLLGISFATLWLGSMKEVLENNEERATSTGLLNASISLSNVAGPLLGGVLAAVLGFRGVMHVAAGLTFLALFLFLVLKGASAVAAVPPSPKPGPAGDIGP